LGWRLRRTVSYPVRSGSLIGCPRSSAGPDRLSYEQIVAMVLSRRPSARGDWHAGAPGISDALVCDEGIRAGVEKEEKRHTEPRRARSNARPCPRGTAPVICAQFGQRSLVRGAPASRRRFLQDCAGTGRAIMAGCRPPAECSLVSPRHPAPPVRRRRRRVAATRQSACRRRRKAGMSR